MCKTKLIICLCGVLLGAAVVAGGLLVYGANRAQQGRGRIAGRVQDEQGRPLANVGIVIVTTTARGSYPEILPVSNEQGEFNLSELPPGRYTLRATLDGYQPGTQSVEVQAQRTARVEFVLKK